MHTVCYNMALMPYWEGTFDGKNRRNQEAGPKGHGQMKLNAGYRRKKYDDVKRLAEDRDTWKKMTHQRSNSEYGT